MRATHVQKTKRPLTELETLEDMLTAISVPLDEEGDPAARLRGALMSELAPGSLIAKMLVSDIVEVELELRRLRRWITALLNARAEGLMELALGEVFPERDPRELHALARRWGHGEPEAAAELARAGVDVTRVVARARESLADYLVVQERQVERCEERRRRLLADLRSEEATAARRAVPEAEIADAGPDETGD